MKKHRIKPTKKQISIMKDYWISFQSCEEIFFRNIGKLEEQMSKECGIEGLEFFQCDGDWCGIGNSTRTMKLIQRDELDDK